MTAETLFLSSNCTIDCSSSYPFSRPLYRSHLSFTNLLAHYPLQLVSLSSLLSHLTELGLLRLLLDVVTAVTASLPSVIGKNEIDLDWPAYQRSLAALS